MASRLLLCLAGSTAALLQQSAEASQARRPLLDPEQRPAPGNVFGRGAPSDRAAPVQAPSDEVARQAERARADEDRQGVIHEDGQARVIAPLLDASGRPACGNIQKPTQQELVRCLTAQFPAGSGGRSIASLALDLLWRPAHTAPSPAPTAAPAAAPVAAPVANPGARPVLAVPTEAPAARAASPRLDQNGRPAAGNVMQRSARRQ